MICRLLYIQDENEWIQAASWLKMRSSPDQEVETSVQEIIRDVKDNGDEALLKLTRKFDCPNFSGPLRIGDMELERAAASIPAHEREMIASAAANIRSFHEAQLERSWFVTRPDGTILGQRISPVDSAGLYVPGGKGGLTPLISSLLMNAIPAQVAGCPRIVVVSPPTETGNLNPHLLAAVWLLNIEEVYRVGGAWSIAALALGTRTIRPVDVIAGPGNIYVTTAKRLLQGSVGIDMIAGPSEVLILADSSANPVWVAADMLSQAEHDPLASAICVATDKKLAQNVGLELEKQLQTLPRAEIASAALANWGAIVIVPDFNVGAAIANLVAPEHLELCCRDPWGKLPAIRHAGAVFLGHHSPEPLGDYYAGPNHVLPTLGTARFSSSLSVQTFCKRTNIIAASPSFLDNSIDEVAAFARLEGLEAHARSMETRSAWTK